MTYDEAILRARRGQKLARPHWHWVYLSVMPPTNVLYVFNEEHEPVAPYTDDGRDRTANDWYVKGE